MRIRNNTEPATRKQERKQTRIILLIITRAIPNIHSHSRIQREKLQFKFHLYSYYNIKFTFSTNTIQSKIEHKLHVENPSGTCHMVFVNVYAGVRVSKIISAKIATVK